MEERQHTGVDMYRNVDSFTTRKWIAYRVSADLSDLLCHPGRHRISSGLEQLHQMPDNICSKLHQQDFAFTLGLADGGWESWSPWSGCTGDLCSKARSRVCRPPLYGGILDCNATDAGANEVEPCPVCPVGRKAQGKMKKKVKLD